jgi:hypothetical protein
MMLMSWIRFLILGGEEPPIRAVVVSQRCGSFTTVRGEVQRFGAGLLCGIGEDQKRAAFGIGWRGDTSPLGGLLAVPRGSRAVTC